MTSVQSLPRFRPHLPANKISKSKARKAVKPILKRLSTQSEKNSLDLDRGCADTDGYYGSRDSWGGYEQTAKETSITFNEAVDTRRYNNSHSRSISGASHVSVATSGSSSRRQVGAPFVHPFQQTPRTSTPPLSYANSLASFVDITEDDDDDENNADANNSNSEDSTYTHHKNPLHIHPVNPLSHSQPSLGPQRPSLTASQRTASFDAKNAHTSAPRAHHQPSLKINTSRAAATPTQSSRLVNVSSRSELDLDRMLDTPISPSNAASNHISSPASSTAPMSPLRSSFDASGFPRLRAKSDLDTATRAEHVREARRKFVLKEQIKEEKYAREEIKRRERADNKRALEMEKQAAAIYKEQMAVKARQEAAELQEAISRGKHSRKYSMASSNRPSLAISRTSMSRPGTSRRNTASPPADAEKFASSNYDTVDESSPLSFDAETGGAQSVVFQSPKRKNTAKRKTQSTWTMFILWLRTKLLRASKGR
ncbi:hypothetical protein GGS23DRAFT_352387 [Durotheca rogersii]|uniref:uncharacterized protein n=1 Tax=Durotheca rogersii TaxID=419775 RepID=UPI00221F6781|nr:uncharacterized protein GGS23DRAFT_352387 [Durotheca rogersii]KAI5865726.1 hypothetical protein GGS23DRAFT_352387 [Durotheca rogersii]